MRSKELAKRLDKEADQLAVGRSVSAVRFSILLSERFPSSTPCMHAEFRIRRAVHAGFQSPICFPEVILIRVLVLWLSGTVI